MSTCIHKLIALPTDIPMKELFQTAKSQTSIAQNVTVKLELDNGIIGLGGATAMKYVTGETRESLLEAIPQMEKVLLGIDARNYREVCDCLQKNFPNAPGARASVEMALFDALGILTDMPLFRFLGGMENQLRTDVTIPITNPERAEELARNAHESGFNSLKLKVGCGDEEADFERVKALHRGAPGARLRIDANQGFAPDAAIAFIGRIVDAGIPLELVEQPVDKKDLNGLKKVRDAEIAPVAADEAIVTPEDAFKIASLQAADVLNIKLMKCGILGALDVAAICKRAGLGLMLGCMLESRIGISMAVHLACGVGGFKYLDLDAHMLAAKEIALGGFTQQKDLLIPVDQPGLGCRFIQ